MLLNLSNHAATGWSAAQLAAVRSQFGSVVDLPFPSIPPDWTAEEVVGLASDFVDQCAKALVPHAGEANAVHVMGEMTFTFALVSQLQALGIRCVASTTERMSVPAADGARHVAFWFVQFRDYPMLGASAPRESAAEHSRPAQSEADARPRD